MCSNEKEMIPLSFDAHMYEQYTGFTVCEQVSAQEDEFARQLAYWKHQLANVPQVLDVPTDRTRPPMPRHQVSRHLFTLSQELTDALEAFSCQEGVTLYTTLLAAFQTVLYRYSGQEDLLLGTLTSVGEHPEAQGSTGSRSNALALRTDLSGNPTFRALLRRVQHVIHSAIRHDDIPFEQVVKALDLEQDHSHHPLFQVMLSYQSQRSTRPTGQALFQTDEHTYNAGVDLHLQINNRPEGLSGCFVYNTDLFDAATISRMSGHWQTMLEGIIADPTQSLAELPLLTEEERRLLLIEWNDTTTSYPHNQCIHELFEAQVERSPDVVAVCFEHECLTYRQLNSKANQLAHRLRFLGVGPDVLVGICLERSLEMVIGLLGILKAGGAYVPLDPTYPAERLAFMLEDAQVPVLLTQRSLLMHLPYHGIEVVCLEANEAGLEQQSTENPISTVIPDNLAYVIYTSGSTGRPKGVQILHRAVVNFLLSMRQQPGLTAEDSWLAVTTLSFDIAALEIFLPLLTGARLIIASQDVATSGTALAETIARTGTTVMQATPVTWHVLLATGWQGSKALKVLCGGEALPLDLARQLLSKVASLYNMYGPTETTIWSSVYEIKPEHSSISIGRPIANTQIYLLDGHLQLVPVGVPGELYIGGDGLARGYLHRPELTAERFIRHPFSTQPGARIYRTGDLARYRADGTIELIGRIDHQVKIRGFRIELGEIEAVLRQHPQVREAVVAAREDTPGDKRLAAYVILKERQAVTGADLQSYVMNHVPNYMVPSAIVQLDAFPLTPNGKVDRRALPAPDYATAARSENIVVPRTPLEETVAQAWSKALGVAPISIDDDFFVLGGHSLLAMEVIAHLRTALQVELPLRSFFEAPTVAQLAQRIDQQQSSETSPLLLPTIQTTSREQYRSLAAISSGARHEGSADEIMVIPASSNQQGLWLVNQLEPESPTYNLSVELRLHAPLQMVALKRSLQALVERHETLRTTFRLRDEQLVQVIAPTMNVSPTVVDVQNLPQEQREAEVQRLVSREVQQPFDLARGPLLRAMVLHLGPEDHVVLLVMHHIISDGWSEGVLCQELTALYDASISEQPALLPALPIQYADFALWQREQWQQKRLAEQLTYWKQQLAGVPPVLDLPTDHPRPALPTHRGRMYSFIFSKALTQGLKRLSQQEGVTLYITLTAAFNALLYRYTGQEDLVIGTITAGRSQQETRDLIGYFINMLVLRSDLSGNPSVRELLRRVRETVLSAQAHQEVPFERLVQELHPQRSLSAVPLIQVLLTLNPPLPELPSFWHLSQMDLETGTAKMDLALSLAERPEGLLGSLEYNTDLFDDTTIARMMRHWQVLLEGIVADPAQHLAELPLLTEEERHLLLVEWNATQTDYPRDQCYHQLFEAQVERTPDALAVVFEKEQLTYRELNARANQLAHYLRKHGVAPDVVVGLYMERSVAMIVGLLGVLKAGGAYVPLDARQPQERVAFVLNDAQSPVLLTQRRLAETLPALSARILCLDMDWDAIAQESTNNPANNTQPEHLVYVIYTSGSTGKPKGVMISHRALVNYLIWCVRECEMEKGEGSLIHSSISFDLVVTGLHPTLLVGKKLVLLPEDQSVEALANALRTGVYFSMLKLTPSHLKLLNQWLSSEKVAERVRTIVTGGEDLPGESVSTWRSHTPGTLFINEYGPTEATVGAAVYEIPADVSSEVIIPLGRPLYNTQFYVLDNYLQPVPIGVPGQLYIGGDGLARGYLNRPELTTEKFIANPFSTEAGVRLYKTGDLVRYRANGLVDFLGRLDHQVKIRGFRIELGEIETVLRGYRDVREVVVVAHEVVSGDKRLVAYVVLYEEATTTSMDLYKYTQQYLPAYMVPSAFMLLDKLPINANGKVDRLALPTPDMTRSMQEETFVEAGSLVQSQLVQIWEELLDVRPIGVRDNFFSLGGHSLLAARLVDRITHVCGKKIPLSALFAGPTIEQLAHALLQDADQTARTSVVAVQASGSRRPFFFLHGDWTGGAFYCFALARALGPEQPFYVLETYKFTDLQVLPTLEEMVSAHIETMRTIQPEGPYLLGGFCNGGLLAYEMARQLEEAGQQVDFLGLINPTTVDESYKILSIINRVGQVLRVKPEKQAHWYLRARHALRHVYRHLRPGDERLLDFHKLTAIDPRLNTMFPPLEALYNDYVGVFNWLVNRYTLRAYPGKITFYWAADEPYFQEYWSQALVMKDKKAIEHHILPGTHMSCVTDHTEVLAQRLSESLKQSQEVLLDQVV